MGIKTERGSSTKPYSLSLLAQVLTTYVSSFLAYVDLLGTTYEDNTIATGYGAYIALPLLREVVDKKGVENITEEDARKILMESMKVLFYRDARSLNKVCTRFL